jgi:hypothetical protein
MITLEPVVTRFWGSLLITGSANGFGVTGFDSVLRVSYNLSLLKRPVLTNPVFDKPSVRSIVETCPLVY